MNEYALRTVSICFESPTYEIVDRFRTRHLLAAGLRDFEAVEEGLNSKNIEEIASFNVGDKLAFATDQGGFWNRNLVELPMYDIYRVKGNRKMFVARVSSDIFNDLFAEGPFPDELPENDVPAFRVAKLEDLEAIKEGVPLEDLYA